MKTTVESDVKDWKKFLAERFEPRPENLIPALQFLQEYAGYLPREAITSVAEYLKVPQSKVFGVASFYAQFRFEPGGRNTVTVCRGTACHVRGSAKLLSELERQLGVRAGGTTQDFKFSLETVACYGSCALAPVVVMNSVVYRQQTTSSLNALIRSVEVQAESKQLPDRERSKSSQGKRRPRGADNRRESK